MHTAIRNSILGLFCFTLLMTISSCGDREKRDEDAILEYLEDKGLTGETDGNGVYYVILEPGNEEMPVYNSKIDVHYEGRYLDDEIFDSSLSGDPLEGFFLYQLIEGWQLGIPKFGKGGKGHLYIPSRLAYGKNPPNGIRKNAPMTFYIELIDFE